MLLPNGCLRQRTTTEMTVSELWTTVERQVVLLGPYGLMVMLCPPDLATDLGGVYRASAPWQLLSGS